ncbi:hypothetical protein [Streptomyces sp. NPDC056069]|uniref:hypothetical protein n=1 Tax=Streptomyces sp. NPDC056069 TaxID=3345702 RepID=UPI0035E264D0
MLRAIAQLGFSPPPPEPLARCYHQGIRELIDLKMAPVVGDQTTSGWLLQALQAIDEEETTDRARDGYGAWVAAACRTFVAILEATKFDDLLPGRSVLALSERIQNNLAETLNALIAPKVGFI